MLFYKIYSPLFGKFSFLFSSFKIDHYFFLKKKIKNIFIRGVYSEAYEKSHDALLKFRAISISEYESLEKIYFYPPSPEPKYIYYLGESESYGEWDTNVKKREADQTKLYTVYEEEVIKRTSKNYGYNSEKDEDKVKLFNQLLDDVKLHNDQWLDIKD